MKGKNRLRENLKVSIKKKETNETKGISERRTGKPCHRARQSRKPAMLGKVMEVRGTGGKKELKGKREVSQ